LDKFILNVTLYWFVILYMNVRQNEDRDIKTILHIDYLSFISFSLIYVHNTDKIHKIILNDILY
jgi:hypothetical protein